MSAGMRVPWTGARVVVDGQSLNNPVGVASGTEWPIVVREGRVNPIFNVSVSGAGWANLISTAATRLHPQAINSASKNILILEGGQTEIAFNVSGAGTFSNMVTYANAARAAGFTHVIGCTIPSATSWTAGQLSARLVYNQAIRDAEGVEFDAVVDLAATPLDDGSDTTYFVDGLHFSVVGHILAADTIGPIMDTVIAA